MPFPWQEPSSLLLITSCLLNIWNNGSTEIFNLFTIFCGCCTLTTLVCRQTKKLSIVSQILASILIFGPLFDFISNYLSCSGSLDFLFIRLTIGVSIVVAYNDLQIRFGASFSPGELCIVTQGLFSLIAISLMCAKSILFQDERFNFALPTQVILVLCESLFQFTFILKVLSYTQLNSTIIFPATLVLSLGVAYCIFWTHLLPKEPIAWLINQAILDDTRVKLLIQWSACLSVTIAFTLFWSKLSRDKASSPQRKLFHVPIFLVFITGIKEDVQFLSFASACLLIVFFIAECIRLSKTGVVASFIDSVFENFRDEKDSGPLTLTHAYLLIGCALPVWLCLNGTRSHLLFSACSGVISIGLGDSAASIYGFHWGKRKWPGSKKSYEGTAAAFIAQIFGSIFLLNYLYPDKTLTLAEFLVIGVTCFTVSLVEALTNEIDNLVLSLYFFIILQGLSIMCNISI